MPPELPRLQIITDDDTWELSNMPFVTVLKMFVNNFPSKCFSEHNAGYRRSSPDPRMLRTPSLLPALHRHLPRDEVGVCGGIFEHESLHCS